MTNISKQKGFSLVELVIVISVILVLAIGVFLILDPVQMTARSRDTNRVSDFEVLKGAIGFAAAEAGVATDNWDPDGAYDGDADSSTQSCSGDSDQRVFVSVPSDNGETSPVDLPTGWSYARVTEANLQNIDGTGWVPVDFTVSGSVTPPISHLPADDINTFASGFYYSYVCDRSPRKYELNSRMASEQYRTGGAGDAQSGDGGDDIFAYEVGSDIGLNPKAPIGHWAFDDGSGTAVIDSVGGNDGAVSNGAPTWETDCIFGGCLGFDETSAGGTGDEVLVNNANYGLDAITAVAWINPEVATSGRAGLFRVDGFYFQHLDDTRITTYWYDWTNAGYHNSPAGSVPTGTWTHVASSRDNINGVRLLVNGSETFQIASTTASARSTNWVRFGREDATRIYNGVMDEALLYDRPLTEEELTYQYEALKP